MSIHGGQPIPCWRQEQCAEAWEGKNYCDLSLQQCTRACDKTGQAQPVAGSTKPVLAYAETPDNAAKDTNWQQAADRMWSDLLNFQHLKVPGKKDPSILDKLVFIFFGSPYRADISGVLIIALAVILFLL